jgi:hypothetical protein
MNNQVEAAPALATPAVKARPAIGSGSKDVRSKRRIAAPATTREEIRQEAMLHRIALLQAGHPSVAALSIEADGETETFLQSLLIDQLATCHHTAMNRFTANRLMGSFQRGLLALDTLRRGGRQHVTVQHVNVNEGAQAVIAAELKTGGQNGHD